MKPLMDQLAIDVDRGVELGHTDQHLLLGAEPAYTDWLHGVDRGSDSGTGYTHGRYWAQTKYENWVEDNIG